MKDMEGKFQFCIRSMSLAFAVACLLGGLSISAWSYTSMDGHFTCSNPLGRIFGAKVEDGPGYVGFSNDLGERYRVDTMPEEPGTAEYIAEKGQAKVLQALLRGYYYPELIQRSVPGATVLEEGFK